MAFEDLSPSEQEKVILRYEIDDLQKQFDDAELARQTAFAAATAQYNNEMQKIDDQYKDILSNLKHQIGLKQVEYQNKL